MKNYLVLKNQCRFIFFVGSGNFWYEEGIVGNDRSFLYHAYSFIVYGTLTILTTFEILAIVAGDFPREEKNDGVSFSVSHFVILTKIFIVMSKKTLMRQLNRNMVEACEKYEVPEIDAEKYRIIRINIFAYVVAVYATILFCVIEALRNMDTGAGYYFIVLRTYYPPSGDVSLAANCVRVTTAILLMIFMIPMTATEMFAVMHLIMLKYKIITLRQHFEDLRHEFEIVSKREGMVVASQKLTESLVQGIVTHERLLKMAKDIHEAFGFVISLQLAQSFASAVSCLLFLALTKNLTFATTMKIVLFVGCLFFMLGLFLCNAGEISYQTSLLSESIFYCGWHLVPPMRLRNQNRRNLRSIVLITCAQAQRPLVMKAFKMVDLTYATFLSVMKGTYSVFALLYAKNKQS